MLYYIQLSGLLALAGRGDCAFTTKGNVAQAAGALALLVMNDDEGFRELASQIFHLHLYSFILFLQTPLMYRVFYLYMS